MVTIDDIIRLYQLEPLPVEGGFFRQTYRAEEMLPSHALPARYRHDKPISTAILYLLTDHFDSFSALHLLPTDEVYHFYLGDAVELLQLYPDGRSQRVILGQDIVQGQRVQYVAPHGVWMGSYLRPGGKYALLGTTMAPGFTNDDYIGGDRETLVRQYPQEMELITRLTRLQAPLAMAEEQ